MPSFSVKDPQVLRTIILEHYQHPANKLDAAPKGQFVSFHNKSTSCIDDFTVYVQVVDRKVAAVYYTGIGCAISTAAGSIVSKAVVGMSVSEAVRWLDNYAAMISGTDYDEQALGEAIAFHTISQLPSRVKCALAVPESIQRLLQPQAK